MSFWSRLGEVDDEIREQLAGVTFDIAKTFTDDEQAQEIADWVGRNKLTFGGVGGAVMDTMSAISSYGVMRPLSTLQQQAGFGVLGPGSGMVLSRATGQETGNLFSADDWREAWNRSEDVSLGQAFLGSRSVEQSKALNETLPGKITSGAIDGFTSVLLDPTAIAGGAIVKGAKAARTIQGEDVASVFAHGEDVTSGAVSLTARQARQRRLIDRFLKETDGKTVSELAQTDMFRQSSDAGALAYWFGRANDEADEVKRLDMKREILGAAFGDRDAVGRLREKSARLADEIESMSSEIDELATFDKAVEARWDPDFLVNQRNNTKAIEQINAQRDKITEALAQHRRLEEVALSGAVREVRRGGVRQAIRTDIAGRKIGSYSPDKGYARISKVIHNGMALEPIHVVTGKKIPGVFSARDDQAVDIFADALARARELAPEVRRKYLDDFTVADVKQRAAIASMAERSIFGVYGKKYGLKADEMRALLRETTGRRGKYLSALQSRLYSTTDEQSFVPWVDPEDGAMFAIDKPLLSSQLTDAISIVDPRVLDSTLKRATRRGNGGMGGYFARVADKADEFGALTEAGLSRLNRLWKFSALFRGAYPMRVQVDTQLRLLASLEGAYLPLAAQGTKNYVKSLRFLDNQTRRELSERIGMTGEQYRGVGIDAYRSADEFGEKVGKVTGSGVNDVTPGFLSSEQSVLTAMTDATHAQLRDLRASGNWDRLGGDAPNWESAYLRAVNMQIKNDPVAQLLIAGRSDDEIIQWLAADQRGREHWDLMRRLYERPEYLVSRVRDHVDSLLPENLRNILPSRNITAEDVKATWRLPSQRPAVHGELLDESRMTTALDKVDDLAGRWYKAASTLPEDIMGRHPFYVAKFQEHMRRAIDRTYSVDGKVSASQVEAARKAADKLARRDIGETLYEMTRQSNLAHALRFVMPFYAPWEDTMVKWGRILGANPGIAARARHVWEAPNAAGLVVDQDGNTVKENGDVVNAEGEVIGKKTPFDSDQWMVIPQSILPKSLRENAGVGSIRLSKTSFNIVFQGDPWWLPGWGPMATVPANEIIKSTVEGPLHGDSALAKWLLPYGPEADATDMIVPAWARHLQSAFDEDSKEFSGVYARLMSEEMNRFGRGERSEQPSHDEIANKTRNWFLLRWMAAETIPVSAVPDSPLQFYRNEWNRYQREYGNAARDRFFEDYPEYFDLALSSTESESGLRYSEASWEEFNKYREDAARNPEFSWMFAGAANIGGEFSDSVYAAMLSQSYGYGNNEKIRRPKDAMTAVRDAQVNKGWMEYNAGMTKLRVALEERGLHSFSQRGAEDLDMVRREFIEDLKARNEPWLEAYGQRDSNKVERFFRTAAEGASQHKGLRERNDFKLYQEYLESRSKVRALLATRDTKSLDHPSNADVKLVWEQYTADLASRDLGFEQAWNLVLSGDDLSREINVSLGG